MRYLFIYFFVLFLFTDSAFSQFPEITSRFPPQGLLSDRNRDIYLEYKQFMEGVDTAWVNGNSQAYGNFFDADAVFIYSDKDKYLRVHKEYRDKAQYMEMSDDLYADLEPEMPLREMVSAKEVDKNQVYMILYTTYRFRLGGKPLISSYREHIYLSKNGGSFKISSIYAERKSPPQPVKYHLLNLGFAKSR